MGSSTILDILGSMIVGGLLLLVALRMNDQATRHTFDSQEQLTVQQNMTFLIQMVESDFTKIGYNSNPLVPFNQGQYIQYADTSDVRFLVDLDTSGSYSTIEWILGGVVNAVSGARELDRIVTKPNGTVTTERYLNIGVTRFFMQYFGSNNPDSSLQVPGVPITTGNGIQTIELLVAIVPVAAYDTAYYSNISVWRQKRLMSMNLRGR